MRTRPRPCDPATDPRSGVIAPPGNHHQGERSCGACLRPRACCDSSPCADPRAEPDDACCSDPTDWAHEPRVGAPPRRVLCLDRRATPRPSGDAWRATVSVCSRKRWHRQVQATL
eukprot:Amastigsp_a179417_38.p5 type:complete len:115 gc:universal Amastigsp_a179417_38:455-111(-)